MRRMLTISIVAALIMIAAPALADQTVTIEHEPSPHITERSGDDSGFIRSSIVGHYLWVLYDHDFATDGYASDSDQNVSVDISDPTITGAVIGADGTVTLLREQAEEPEPEEIDVVEENPEIDWGFLLHLLKHA